MVETRSGPPPHESVQRPVWLFSLDSRRYPDAFPLTSGYLKAYYVANGKTVERTDFHIVDFRSHIDPAIWLARDWAATEQAAALKAVSAGLRPVAAISCYTWNIDEFLGLVRGMKAAIPQLLVVAGGPQVQEAEAYLSDHDIDVIAIGEGEISFQEILDACFSAAIPLDRALDPIAGIAFLRSGTPARTTPRNRISDLSSLPSPLDAVPLRDVSGGARYRRVAYETSRGCPFHCAFCEWGTGAIGTKMYQHRLDRVRSDLERLVQGGVEEIFFTDSNFGAFPEDLEKARILAEIRKQVAGAVQFCTSWSKSHTQTVRQIVRVLHRAGLIEHYTLALQTLTPAALEVSHRANMPINGFREIVDEMIREGIPISSELIWGLPGDNLADFERNLDELTAIFPSISIYGYTLLPGTEFYDLRERYRIETQTLREFGNWKLDYVVSSVSFDRAQGMAGYFLVTAHILLNRGNILPLVTRYIALQKRISASYVLRTAMRELLVWTDGDPAAADTRSGLDIYADRERIYLKVIGDREAAFRVLRAGIERAVLETSGGDDDLWAKVGMIMEIDEALCPRNSCRGEERVHRFEFDAASVLNELSCMRAPAPALFEARRRTSLSIVDPKSAGDLLAPRSLPVGVERAHHAVVP